MGECRTGFCLSGQGWRVLLSAIWREGACLLLIWHGYPAEREMRALRPVIINKDKENRGSTQRWSGHTRVCANTRHAHLPCQCDKYGFSQVRIIHRGHLQNIVNDVKHPRPLKNNNDKNQNRAGLTGRTLSRGETQKSCGRKEEANGRALATSWLPRLLIELPMGSQVLVIRPHILAHQSIKPLTQPACTSVDIQAEK